MAITTIRNNVMNFIEMYRATRNPVLGGLRFSGVIPGSFETGSGILMMPEKDFLLSQSMIYDLIEKTSSHPSLQYYFAL
jgi:hypothetical protein